MKKKFAALLAFLALAGLTAWIRLGPLPDGLLDQSHFVSTRVVDRNGEVLYESLSPIGTRGDRIEANAIPKPLADATLAAEDRRFRGHWGIDPVAIARAAWRNARSGKVVEGGSTITQQVVKQLLVAHGERGARTGVRGKLNEALLALRLEHRLTKDEILALYLNLAPYGNQYVGARRASLGYFNREPAMLTPAQAAFIAGLPQRPSAYDPYRRFPAAAVRQRTVLGRMAALGMIAGDELGRAKAERIALVRSSQELVAPHFVEKVLAETKGSGARTIETTLDAELQRQVRGIIRSFRPSLEKHAANNVAVAVLDNRTGEWLAWEGSGDYFDSAHGGAIDGVTAPRQPGSALKPFTYALAFESGSTPATLLADVPSHFATRDEGILYTPRNYDGRFRGPLRARLALAGSQNVPAVALAAQLGVAPVLRFFRRAGFTTFDRNADVYGLGLTLGNAEVRLDQLVAAYAAFARNGEIVTPRALRTKRGPSGPAERETRLVSPTTAFWITDVLSDDDARAWVFGHGSSLEFFFPVAVKTGTSQSYHDNWAVGYTRDVTVGVWVGNFDRTPLRNSSGVTGAAPIFRAVMLAALQRLNGRLPAPTDPPIVERPASLERREICALTGLDATERCPVRTHEWLQAGTSGRACDWHHIDDGEPVVVWPPEYQAWARAEGLLQPRAETPELVASGGDAQPQPAHPSRSVRRSSPLLISSPPTGATYLIDPTLRREFQAVPLRVAVAGAPRMVTWTINGRSLGEVASNATLDWPLVPGTHVFRVSDGAHVAQSTIVVR